MHGTWRVAMFLQQDSWQFVHGLLCCAEGARVARMLSRCKAALVLAQQGLWLLWRWTGSMCGA